MRIKRQRYRESRRAARIVAACCLFLVALPASALDPEQISHTAVGVTCWRAFMARDPNPQTRNPDYLAEKFLDEELVSLSPVACKTLKSPFAEAYPAVLQSPGASVAHVVVVRTKHIDAMLEASLAQGVKQVVILGAGLDSRAYRMGTGHQDVRFFEVDSPATQQDKKQRVRRMLGDLPEQVVYVPIDFETQSLEKELAAAGHRAGEPSFFVWEGVTMYLTAEAVDATLEFAGKRNAPGSSIIFDYALASVVDGTYPEPPAARAMRLAVLKQAGEPWLFGIAPGKANELVERHGLELVSDLAFQPLFQKYLTAELAERILGKSQGRGAIACARVPQ